MNIHVICFFSVALLFFAPALSTALVRARWLPTILLFSFLAVLQQLLFAFFAAVTNSYAISVLLSALIVLLVGWVQKRAQECADETGADGDRTAPVWYRILPWCIFLVLFIGYAAIRAQYSSLQFNNNGNDAGVEKLFNLSLQQSFLFGRTYPPEWIWLAGEPIRYYTFLKSFAGIASWIARVVFGNAETGGIFFILSEAGFGALAPALLCAWILWFGRNSKSLPMVGWIGGFLGCFCFLSTHYQALWLGLTAFFTQTSLDWWSLSKEVIPFTDNQYPVWLMILGDNHAYMQVYFLQILFWGGFLSVLLLEEVSISKGMGLGVIAASLAISHSGSVIVDGVVCGSTALLLAGFFTMRKQWRQLKICGLNGAIVLGVAGIFLCLLYKPAGNVKYVLLESSQTSRFLPFLNLNFSILVWIGVLGALVLPEVFSRLKTIRTIDIKDEWIVAGVIVTTIGFFLMDRPALAILIAAAAFTYFVFAEQKPGLRGLIFSCFALCSFLIWFLPELIAFDHVMDDRVSWIRFQMSLRFWPEGYYLIPFAVTVVALQQKALQKISKPWIVGTACVITLFLASHIPGIQNRIVRTGQAHATVNGFEDYATRYPGDEQIVSFIRALPEIPKVVIGESCGSGDARIPVDFGWSGRIAAFSGRTGICGWSRHAMLYNNPLTQDGFKGASVEGYTADYLKEYLHFFSFLINGNIAQAKISLSGLKTIGVTHIVFGEFEKKLMPEFTMDMIPSSLPVTVLMRGKGDMGIIKIDE